MGTTIHLGPAGRRPALGPVYKIYKILRTDHHLIIENGHNLKSYLKDVNDENMNYDTFDKDVNDKRKLVIFHTDVNDEYRKSDTFDKDCQQYKDGRD